MNELSLMVLNALVLIGTVMWYIMFVRGPFHVLLKTQRRWALEERRWCRRCRNNWRSVTNCGLTHLSMKTLTTIWKKVLFSSPKFRWLAVSTYARDDLDDMTKSCVGLRFLVGVGFQREEVERLCPCALSLGGRRWYCHSFIGQWAFRKGGTWDLTSTSWYSKRKGIKIVGWICWRRWAATRKRCDPLEGRLLHSPRKSKVSYDILVMVGDATLF